MKVLSLDDTTDRFGEYGPACESFIDSFKKLFKHKSPQAERAEILHGAQYKELSVLSKDLDRDLRSTYENAGWVEKNLTDEKETVEVTALEHANLKGKALTDPREIVKAARAMMEVVHAIAAREQPHIELRRKLIARAVHIKDNAELDQLWVDNAKQLEQTAVERTRQQYKQALPALGCDEKTHTWPLDYLDKRHSIEFTQFFGVKTSGKIEAPTRTSAREYADAVRQLMEIVVEAEKIAKDTYIPYWDSLDNAIEYDRLKYGDEIFGWLFSSQTANNVSDLAGGIAFELGPIICGLYIVMFDKKLVSKKVANEGFMDIFRSKEAAHKNNEAAYHYKFDSQKVFRRLKAFYAEPGQFQLTGKSFTPEDHLILSIRGHGANPAEIAKALATTWKEATAVNDRMAKDTVKFGRIVAPLIEHFEKTVIAAMDREGNLPQDVLDAAMKPLVANAQRARAANAWNTFHLEASKYDGWLGGNPVQMEQQRLRDGTSYFDIKYDAPPQVPVGKARDAAQLRDILDVLFQYCDDADSFPDMKGSLDQYSVDEDTFFEFDRPVRHLWDVMNDVQRDAITAIYAHESTPGSLFTSICTREWDVAVSIMKYVDRSIASI